MGLWPPKTNDRLFIFFFGYLTIHCCLEYAELIEYIDNLEYVVTNLTENTILTMILVKITAYRLNAKRLHQVLEDVKDDYDEDKYKEPDERLSFLQYNVLAKRFIKISVPIMFLAALMFYLKPLTGQMRASKSRKETHV
uniref:Odorant receptor 29 n=1 Tax=Sirex nitobei TaxID=1602346 RepID=A0A857N3P0_9HYME|nr:odorant receptor 29 [Sirex nitobei]